MKTKAVFLLLLLFQGACTNIFKELADKNTDQAKLYQTRLLVNSQNYDDAITTFESMSVEFLGTSSVRSEYAGALAGKCGLEFIPFFLSLGNASQGGGSFFKFLMNAFTNKTTSKGHCRLAENQIKAIGATSADRSGDENLFMAVLSMVKIGATEREIADTDNDDDADASFDACKTASLPDADLDEIITGFGLIVENSASLSSAGDVGTTVSTINSSCGITFSCSGLSIPNPCSDTIFPASLRGTTVNPCSRINTTDITAADRLVMRILLADQTSGIDDCTASDGALPVCCDDEIAAF